jgi:DNA polymerase III gamma/tau subunit
MIATTHSISQLPATIASRAMIFHVDRLSDDQMNQWMGEFTTQV